MPQMSPMNWLTLFMMFSYLLIFIMLINYSSMQNPPLIQGHTTLTNITAKKLNWKW
nr:ATP synthase F0 subunit 8 [Sanaa intermedia]